METLPLARGKKAAAQRQTIVFIDESVIGRGPYRCRTWAPRGQTPILQYHFDWNLLSAIAGVRLWRFYCRSFPGTIRVPQIIEFLETLQ